MDHKEFLHFQLNFHRWTPEDLARFSGLEKSDMDVFMTSHSTVSKEKKDKVSKCLGLSPEIWNRLG